MTMHRLFVLRLVVGLALLTTAAPLGAQRLIDLPRFPSTTGEPGPDVSLEETGLLGGPAVKLQLRSPVPSALAERTSRQEKDVDLAAGILGASLGALGGLVVGGLIGSAFCDRGCGHTTARGVRLGGLIGAAAGFYHFGTAHWVDPEPVEECRCGEEEGR